MKKKSVYLLVLTVLAFYGNTYGQENKKMIYVAVNSAGDTLISAPAIMELEELIPINSRHKILSFMFSLTAVGFSEQPQPIFNNGSKFNEEVLRLIKYTRPASMIVFYNIKLCNDEGSLFNSWPLVLRAK